MDSREARSFLGLHRVGDAASDPRFRDAEAQASTDPELAAWWNDEQELDRAIAAKLAAAPVPAALKARLASPAVPRALPQRTWQRAALLAAAVIVALAVLFGSWRGPFQPAASLADYRDEMVGFIKVTPSLELETSDMTRIKGFLEKSGAPSQFEMPVALRKLDPIGCRTLRFRGHDVALICFKRGNGGIAHLLVLDRTTLNGLHGKAPQYAAQGEWATAAWSDAGRLYLLAVQGDEGTAERFMSDS